MAVCVVDLNARTGDLTRAYLDQRRTLTVPIYDVGVCESQEQSLWLNEYTLELAKPRFLDGEMVVAGAHPSSKRDGPRALV